MDEIQDRRFVCRYGQGGHEFEHCINIEGYGGVVNDEPDIPDAVFEAMKRLMPLPMMNRGSRIEVIGDKMYHPNIVFVIQLLADATTRPRHSSKGG